MTKAKTTSAIRSAARDSAVAEEPYKVGPGRPPREHQFKPGNPGRPKGSRNKLGEQFIAALCADFETHGADTIERVREEDPAVYLRVVASVVPQTVVHEARLDELSDDELAAFLLALREALGARDAADGRTIAKTEGEPAQALSPLSEAETVP